MKEKIFGFGRRTIYIIVGVFFLPVLICTLFIGHKMGYWDEIKSILLLPALPMAIIAAVILTIAILLLYKFRKITLTRRLNMWVNVSLVILFAGIWFLNNWISKEIAFQLPWDIMVAQGTAYEIAAGNELGFYHYYSFYPNNIPIAWILGKLFYIAKFKMGDLYIVRELLWFQVECAIFSVGGLFTCLSVKKLTKSLPATAIAFGITFVLVCLSPWKTAPYTDAFGLLFPIVSLYCYLAYRDAKNLWSRILLIGASIFSAAVGGFIKPNIYLCIIAIIAVEILRSLKNLKVLWFVLGEVVFTLVLFFVADKAQATIIKDIKLEVNEELASTWQHYFCMGLNEDRTGGWCEEDAGINGNPDYPTKDVRSAYEFSKALGRLKDRGFFGTIAFYLKKMVMVFDDGTFGWAREVWSIGEYQRMDSNSVWTLRLRHYFWPNAEHQPLTNTAMQIVWLFCILGIPGLLIRQKEEYLILAVSFLGIFFYQMLFEARARYLFAFLPVIIVVAVCGMNEYVREKSSASRG